ncbi:MAG: hypothetical protein ACE5HL_01895 [Terriglobia bacterium]
MFRVIHEGVEIHCETAEEAIEIAAKLRGTHPSPRKGKGEFSLTGSRWTVARFKNFAGQLQDKQRKFLRELVSSPDGLTDSALRQSLGLTTNKAFGPILTAISRKAKKVGIDLKEVYTSDKVNLGSGQQVLEFKAAPAFIKVADEAGGLK